MYGALGRPALARAAALRAFEDDPLGTYALRAARFALQDGAVADAEADLERARAAGVDASKAADVEGRIRAAQGRVEEAVAAFAHADTAGAPGLERLTLLSIYGDETDALEQADRLLAARARGASRPATRRGPRRTSPARRGRRRSRRARSTRSSGGSGATRAYRGSPC